MKEFVSLMSNNLGLYSFMIKYLNIRNCLLDNIKLAHNKGGNITGTFQG